jgi:hypothetical protein
METLPPRPELSPKKESPESGGAGTEGTRGGELFLGLVCPQAVARGGPHFHERDPGGGVELTVAGGGRNGRWSLRIAVHALIPLCRMGNSASSNGGPRGS